MKKAIDNNGMMIDVEDDVPVNNINGIYFLLTEKDQEEEAAKEVVYKAEAPERAAIVISEKRRRGYGSLEKQLETIYKHGLDAWKAQRLVIDRANPMPGELFSDDEIIPIPNL